MRRSWNQDRTYTAKKNKNKATADKLPLNDSPEFMVPDEILRTQEIKMEREEEKGRERKRKRLLLRQTQEIVYGATRFREAVYAQAPAGSNQAPNFASLSTIMNNPNLEGCRNEREGERGGRNF